MDDNYQQLSKFMANAIKERDAYNKKLERPIDNSNDDQFLQAIQGVESNFGTNTDHPEVTTGLQAGDKAIGDYAIMPNTIKELANKVSNRDTLLGSTMPYKASIDDIQGLASMPDDQMNSKLSGDPALQNKVARLLQKDVMLKSNGPDDAAYRWNKGQNIPKGSITTDQLGNSDYVQKFNKILQTLKGTSRIPASKE